MLYVLRLNFYFMCKCLLSCSVFNIRPSHSAQEAVQVLGEEACEKTYQHCLQWGGASWRSLKEIWAAPWSSKYIAFTESHKCKFAVFVHLLSAMAWAWFDPEPMHVYKSQRHKSMILTGWKLHLFRIFWGGGLLGVTKSEEWDSADWILVVFWEESQILCRQTGAIPTSCTGMFCAISRPF